MTSNFSLKFCGLSDTGMRRENNEDCIASSAENGFAILADGMGGYKAGEIASAICVATVMKKLEEAIKSNFKDTSEAEVLEDAIAKANKAIFSAAANNEQYRNMGTTVVVLIIRDGFAHYAHVGDSRLYRLRGDNLQQLTSDHSLINELIQKGFYTQDEASKADNKNIITRAMGAKIDVEADIFQSEALLGDIYMLCSDGLTDLVDDNTIQQVMAATRDDPQQTCQELIDLANGKGGKDNVSVIVSKLDLPSTNSASKVNAIMKWLFKH